MIEFKIANVLVEDTRQFRTSPLLYVRTAGDVEPNGVGWKLQGGGLYDFTTFFNALSVKKYDRYTSATGYRLHLCLKGAACKIVLTGADQFDYYPSEVTDVEVE